MENRADRASVNAHGSLRRGLPQVHGRTTGLFNSTCCLKHYLQLHENLRELQPLVTPELSYGASYGWNGGSCPDENQRKFIAETYYLYREIYHQVTLDEAKSKDMSWNVYYGETLTCKDSGEPIKVGRIES